MLDSGELLCLVTALTVSVLALFQLLHEAANQTGETKNVIQTASWEWKGRCAIVTQTDATAPLRQRGSPSGSCVLALGYSFMKPCFE